MRQHQRVSSGRRLKWSLHCLGAWYSFWRSLCLQQGGRGVKPACDAVRGGSCIDERGSRGRRQVAAPADQCSHAAAETTSACSAVQL